MTTPTLPARLSACNSWQTLALAIIAKLFAFGQPEAAIAAAFLTVLLAWVADVIARPSA